MVKSKGIDANKATYLVRRYLERNFGNLGFLLFRVEQVEPNGKKDIYKVLCSLLPNIGSSERVFYYIRINIKTGKFLDVYKGKAGKGIINLRKMNIKIVRN